ncbi:DUF2507 domain-containing protein [Lacticigenium naphthae]|uniref:DUF2507 domain-containing protein n=1 Tax=Lacticigenium naphthae TaxID=515351 RepID=UPI0003F64518|nr:DUF2507 domain-containing protein [Lacticigenium naphthae]
MDNSTQEEKTSQQNTPIDALILLRDNVLPNLFGEDVDAILYWAGKEIARQFPLKNKEDIHYFFHQYGLGELHFVRSKNNRNELKLTGSIISARLKNPKANFSFEAGILAQQLELLQDVPTESSYNIQPKEDIVLFTIKSD